MQSSNLIFPRGIFAPITTEPAIALGRFTSPAANAMLRHESAESNDLAWLEQIATSGPTSSLVDAFLPRRIPSAIRPPNALTDAQ